RIPLRLRRWIYTVTSRMLLGRPERYGLPKPDHKLFETHPIINSQLFYFLGHGALQAKPNVESWHGRQVAFVDGTQIEIDLVICATGYKITLPFLAEDELPWRVGRPDLYLNVFHPRRDNLFFVGLIQPDSGQFGLVDYQAELVARYIAAGDGP